MCSNSNEPREDDRENLDTEPIDSHDITDLDVSTASCSSDDERHCKIDLHDHGGAVTWEDANQTQHLSDLDINLYVDTTKRRAIFALRWYFYFKSGGPKADVSLLIYPERIQSLEFARTRPPIPSVPVPTRSDVPDDSFVSLCVTMTHLPALKVPKDQRLEPKPQYQAMFDAIASLSSVQRFTIYLPNLSPDVHQELALLPNIFSSTYPFDRLRTDEKWVPASALYKYAYDQVIDLVKTPHFWLESRSEIGEELQDLVGDGNVAAPPYPSSDSSDSSQRTVQSIRPSFRKRRASSDIAGQDSHIGSSILGYQTPEEGPQPPHTMSVSLQSPAHFSTPSDRKRYRPNDPFYPMYPTNNRNDVLDFGVTHAEPRAGPSNDIVEQLVQQTIEEVAAPAYTKDGSIRSSEQAITPSDRKHRRTSESPSPSPSTTDKRILTTLAQLAKSHADQQSRLEHLEKRLADSLGCDHTPCRYDTEEAELINSHVNDKIATEMENVQWELEDNLFGETQQLVVEKAEEQQSQLWADMRQDLMDEMRREIKEELMEELRQELAAEVKKELFKDMAQAIMTAACGNGGKSGTGMSQSTQSTDSTQ
ncbi:hypothetical protein N0V85_008586 [Neurospora sp. IMI 360204]|nr:hypothetical protein N0V85_008586 [Neurospora sp. IMI 360204]